MHPTVLDRLATRERARALGDINLERACNADLIRLGFRDEPLETTVAAQPPERAVPAKPKRGRAPRPRCDHDQIIGRCAACEEAEHEPED